HVAAALVDDRVDRDRRLPGLAIADDQLPLATADRDHGVDRLDARLERHLHGLPHDDAGRLELDPPPVLRVHPALSVDRLPPPLPAGASRAGPWGWRPVRGASSPSLMPPGSPMSATPTLSSSRLSAMP